jgi:hypothetical protein
MNKETINCQVVMLPTENMSKLVRQISTSKLFFNLGYSVKSGLAQPQHLYFTSNEEIKEGDWFYHGVSKALKKADAEDVRLYKDGFRYASKIVASTDSSLGLPAIPESFLKQYVAANGKIDKVKLELVDVPDFSSMEYKSILKLTAANEVVVVEQSESDKGYEKFLNNPEEYIEKTRNASEDKELEDAANLSAPGSLYGRFHFKAGAKWQKEQSANDAIELLNWLRDDETSYFLLTNWIQTKKSSKEVYELWQESKNI